MWAGNGGGFRKLRRNDRVLHRKAPHEFGEILRLGVDGMHRLGRNQKKRPGGQGVAFPKGFDDTFPCETKVQFEKGMAVGFGVVLLVFLKGHPAPEVVQGNLLLPGIQVQPSQSPGRKQGTLFHGRQWARMKATTSLGSAMPWGWWSQPGFTNSRKGRPAFW